MAVTDRRVVGGVTRATWDDDQELYREFAANGTTETLSRAYTPVELAMKAERVARAAQIASYASTRAAIASGIAALQADRATLAAAAAASDAVILAAPAAYIKGMASIMVRQNDSLVGLARIVADAL